MQRQRFFLAITHGRPHSLVPTLGYGLAMLPALASATVLPELLISAPRPSQAGTISSWLWENDAASPLPLSANTISAEQLAQWQVQRLDEQTGLQPGLQANPENGQLSNSLQLRGFAVTRPLLDGLPDIQRLFVRDIATVARIDTLRGPAALPFGITSPGGTTNSISKQPGRQTRQLITVQHQLGAHSKLAIDSSGTLGDDDSPWTYRAILAARGGSDAANRHHTAQLTLRWQHQADSWVQLQGMAQADYQPFDFGTVISNTGQPGQPAQPAQVQYDQHYMPAGGAPARRHYQQYTASMVQACSDTCQLQADYRLGLAERNETLLGFWSLQTPGRLSGYYTRYRDDYQQHSWQLKASEQWQTGAWQHQLAAGYSRHRQQWHFTGEQNIGGFSLATLQPDFSQLRLATLRMSPRYSDEQQAERAWWLADRITLGGPHWLSLGLRRQHYHIDSDRSGRGRLPVGDDSASVWHSGYTRQLGTGWHGYLSWQTGLEPNRGQDRHGGFLPAQRSRQTELGLYGQWAAQGRLQLAVFNLALDRLAMADPQDRTALMAAGQRQVQGMEAQTSWAQGPWQLAANLTRLHTAQSVKTSASLGDEFVGVPRLSAGLQLQRQLPDSSCQAWAGVQAAGPRMADAANTLRLPGHARVDTGLRWRSSPAQAVQLGIVNLLDKRYVSAISAPDTLYQGPRRQLWLSYSLSR